MARRTIAADINIWKVYPAGRATVYGKDELGLVFEFGTGPVRKRRLTRYSPRGPESTDAALAERSLSGSSWTSSAGGRVRRPMTRRRLTHSRIAGSAPWTASAAPRARAMPTCSGGCTQL
ncbi:MAG: hypothetical protein ACREJ4_01645 [Candidatus Methylomirabilaceae bacterium]